MFVNRLIDVLATVSFIALIWGVVTVLNYLKKKAALAFLDKKVEEETKSITELESLVTECSLPYMSLLNYADKAAHAVVVVTRTHFTFVNKEMCRILGYTREELLEVAWMSLVHPEDQQATVDVALKLDKEFVTGFRNRYRRKDGSYALLQWRAAPWSGPNGSGLTYASIVEVENE